MFATQRSKKGRSALITSPTITWQDIRHASMEFGILHQQIDVYGISFDVCLLLGGFLDLGPFFGLISRELMNRFLRNLHSYTSHVNIFLHKTWPVKSILPVICITTPILQIIYAINYNIFLLRRDIDIIILAFSYQHQYLHLKNIKRSNVVNFYFLVLRKFEICPQENVQKIWICECCLFNAL